MNIPTALSLPAIPDTQPVSINNEGNVWRAAIPGWGSVQGSKERCEAWITQVKHAASSLSAWLVATAQCEKVWQEKQQIDETLEAKAEADLAAFSADLWSLLPPADEDTEAGPRARIRERVA